VVDIFNFDVSKVPFIPDVIWASCPCYGFSVAQIGRNWNHDNTPKTEKAVKGMEMVNRTKNIIRHFQELNPDLSFIIENPRGKLRKLALLNPYIMKTVTYCQYGDSRMKPMDIWTNLSHYWIPKSMCSNGDSCHQSAPRGSGKGTEGLKDNFERSKVPSQLCEELLQLCNDRVVRSNVSSSQIDSWLGAIDCGTEWGGHTHQNRHRTS
jgi:hypothetical protein